MVNCTIHVLCTFYHNHLTKIFQSMNAAAFFEGEGVYFETMVITVTLINLWPWPNKDFDDCAKNNCLYQPALMWMGINLVITVAGASLVTFLQVSRKTWDTPRPLTKWLPLELVLQNLNLGLMTKSKNARCCSAT